MRGADFKQWLEQRGANTEAGRNTRTHAVRSIESKMTALGSPHVDLESACADDRFAQIRGCLKSMRENSDAGGDDVRIFRSQSERPHKRLSSWGSWLAHYGRFLDGEPQGDDSIEVAKPLGDCDYVLRAGLSRDVLESGA